MQKLLECCKESKIFKPTNPMIAGLLSLLAELHSIKGLKINNSFSIELVFKVFNIAPHDVKPTDMLRAMPCERTANPDWNVQEIPGDQASTSLGPLGPAGRPHWHASRTGRSCTWRPWH